MSRRAAIFDWSNWPGEVTRLLDDHHLVVLSDSRDRRRQFVEVLADHLSTLPDTEVMVLDGARCTDVAGLLEQLGRPVAGEATLGDVAARLNDADPPPARRYLIWADAHLGVEHNVATFGRLVNTLLGVAAEYEHLGNQSLVLQRVVFVGDAKLGAYAEDDQGQFQTWLSDDEEESPVWEAATVLDRPPVITYRLDG